MSFHMPENDMSQKEGIPSVVVFDLGGVLIGWDPARAIMSRFSGNQEAARSFLESVNFAQWNLEQDRGRPWHEANEAFNQAFPEHTDLLEQYAKNFQTSLTGIIAGSVSILEQLHARGVPLYAITNWAADTFERTRQNYPFLSMFRDIVVSGEEKCVKPNPEIYHILLRRNGLKSEACVFIDDNMDNVRGAQNVGMHGIHFVSPEMLKVDLERILHISMHCESHERGMGTSDKDYFV